ncbi:MAG: tetratricopeptide repeat protein [Acidobacteriota bacterium]|nr:tetratricopeptide repeat protein [Acidobacteriota bacterium]
MNAPPIDWISAIAVLVAGLVLGVLFFYFNKRKAQTLGSEADLEQKDLEAKRDALVQQLRDPSLGADERSRLETETAEALRKLDTYGNNVPAGTISRPAAAPAMNPSTKGFLWGAISIGALFALGYFVMQQAKPRQEGEELTGSIATAPQQQAPAQGQPDPMLQQLQSAVQAQPNNLQLRNDLAQAYLERNNLMAVFQETKFVLDQAPEDSRALTLQGLVRMAMGDAGEATKMLQRATKNDPKNLDSWVSLAWVYAQTNRMDDAERMIAEAGKQAPQEKARLDQVFVQMKEQIAQSAMAQSAQGGALPEGHPPIDGAPAAPAAAPAASPAPAASGAGVRVTLDLDPSAKQRTGIVFVIARNPAGGPPVAVKRVVATSFPFNLELTSADSMMGQPLPASFRLEARLDTDGDAMTKPATDPSAMQEGVAPGASVRLALK